jgi:hypothetical protein
VISHAYYDPAKPGFGLVLTINDLGAAIFGTFYGFDQNGDHVWYTLQRDGNTENAGVFDLLRTDTVGDGSFPIGGETSTKQVGTVTVTQVDSGTVRVEVKFDRGVVFSPPPPSQDWSGTLSRLY